MKPNVLKKNHKFLIESGKLRIMEILFKFPEKEFSLSELAKLSNTAKANIGSVLNDLNKFEYIEIIKLSNLWRIKAKQNSLNYIRSKIVYNLNFIYLSGLIEFLSDYFKNPKSITVFGSFRKGEDTTDSDIDIAIESEESKDYQVIGLKELSKFEEDIGRKIQIHLFNKQNIDIHVFNNIINGIVLEGFLQK